MPAFTPKTSTTCPTCRGPRKKAATGDRGGQYYYCTRCHRTTPVDEPTQPPDAHSRYRNLDLDGTLLAMLHRYETENAPAEQLAQEAGVCVRTIYRRLRWTRQYRAHA